MKKGQEGDYCPIGGSRKEKGYIEGTGGKLLFCWSLKGYKRDRENRLEGITGQINSVLGAVL